MASVEWPYYRIYLQTAPNQHHSKYQDEYAAVLREVVAPLWNEVREHCRHIHFFRYAGEYAQHPEGAGVVKPITADDAEFVHFIRLRVGIEAEKRDHYEGRLGELVEKSRIVKGVERVLSDYSVEDDLGGRFGRTRMWLVADLLQAASLLALTFAVGEETYDPHPSNQGGSLGLVHLVSNTLSYRLISPLLTGYDWSRSWSVPPGAPFP